MSSAGARRLLVFARDPRPGTVKTRLIPALGAAGATAIYRRLLEDTLGSAAQVRAEGKELWADRLGEDSPLPGLAAAHRMAIRLQAGADLGARMQLALRRALVRARCAVLIGSDCPGYSAAYLEAAFAALDRHDAVLGPAGDGGYVLIGLRRCAAGLFDGIPWGDAQVAAATRERLRVLGWTWHELATLADVDRPADLWRFPHLAALAPGAREPAT